MTEEQQQLYDIVSDWWDSVFTAASSKNRDACLIDLVNSVVEWKNKQALDYQRGVSYDNVAEIMAEAAEVFKR